MFELLENINYNDLSIPDGSERHLPWKLSISSEFSSDNVANTDLDINTIIPSIIIIMTVTPGQPEGQQGCPGMRRQQGRG